jgi:hypothetical protein
MKNALTWYYGTIIHSHKADRQINDAAKFVERESHHQQPNNNEQQGLASSGIGW